jgi:hypothetical protein
VLKDIREKGHTIVDSDVDQNGYNSASIIKNKGLGKREIIVLYRINTNGDTCHTHMIQHHIIAAEAVIT